MASINDLDNTRWSLIKKGLPFNPEFAIPALWLKNPQLGSPIGPEVKLDDGTTAQPFANGIILWSPGHGAWIREA